MTLWTPDRQRALTGEPPKPRHYAAKVSPAGEVSALCFTTARAIDLTQASWTIRPEAVTCASCRQLIGDR